MLTKEMSSRTTTYRGPEPTDLVFMKFIRSASKVTLCKLIMLNDIEIVR